jgi:hypothetical protein
MVVLTAVCKLAILVFAVPRSVSRVVTLLASSKSVIFLEPLVTVTLPLV